MTQATLTKILNVPAETVWEIISDYANIKNYHPFVDTSPMLSGHERGIGATRRCEFYDNTSIVEKVVDWQEGQSYAVELSEGSMPLKEAVVTMRVSPVDANASEVTIEMDFVEKFGVPGKIMGVIMMRPMMKKMFSKVLDSLERHALTGKIIGKNGAPITT